MRLQRFFNQHAPKSTPGTLQTVIDQLPTEDGQAVALDLCCGRGQLTAMLAEQGYQAYGLDIADRYIGQHGGDAHGFITADVNDLPLRSACANVVCCIESLQYFADPDAVLAEMARLLEPGGTLILSTQNNYNLVGVKKWIIETVTGRHWSPWLAHPVENRVTYPWLIQALERHGFEVEYVRGQQFLTAWVALLPGFIRGWTPWPGKPWRTLNSIAQRVTLARRLEESVLARFAMIVFLRARKC